MEETLKWAEQAGLENMKFRVQNAEQLTKDATSTLTLLLAGVGGALAIVTKSFDGSSHQSVSILAGAGAMAVYFMLLAALILHWCIQTNEFPAPRNEPKNLFKVEYALIDLRQWELENLQSHIEQLTARNFKVAVRLDWIRYAAAASPIIFVIAVLASVHAPALFARV